MRWTHAVAGFSIAVLLTACGVNVEGTYIGRSSALFGMVPLEMRLTIEADKATLVGQYISRPLVFSAKQDGDRVIMRDAAGTQLVFHVAEKGKQLRCPQCKSIDSSFPDLWEKI